MARVLSQVIDIARGSVGGLTWTANQWHQLIMRAKTAPVNPNTTRQSEIRSAFSGAEGVWEQMSDAQRQGWVDYAATCKKSGPLGDYYLTGRLMFLRNLTIAGYLDNRGIAIADFNPTPPLIPGWYDMLNVATGPPVAIGTGFNLSIQNPGAETVMCYAFISIGFNPSRYRFKGPFKSESLIGSTALAGAGFAHDFLGLQDGLAYFYFVRAITDVAPHRTSVRFIGRAIAEVTGV